ncbi:hypothetical protein [Pendulispora albinea]|uniref:Uncharacterized protein n=1 Tax=Pendulispora albinea TaxID=2741071 RepID=A0ABZ2LP14_9BACT
MFLSRPSHARVSPDEPMLDSAARPRGLHELRSRLLGGIAQRALGLVEADDSYGLPAPVVFPPHAGSSRYGCTHYGIMPAKSRGSRRAAFTQGGRRCAADTGQYALSARGLPLGGARLIRSHHAEPRS